VFDLVALIPPELFATPRIILAKPNHLQPIRAVLIESGFDQGVDKHPVEKFFHTRQKQHSA